MLTARNKSEINTPPLPEPSFISPGKDYGVIFAIATVMFAFAFLLMLFVRRGERAEQATGAVPVK